MPKWLWWPLGGVLAGLSALCLFVWWPPPWTFRGISSAQWTAFGTMVIAAVAILVGVAEWHRTSRDRRLRYLDQVDRLSITVEEGILTYSDGIYGEFEDSPPEPGLPTCWKFTITNNSDRRFRGLQVLIQYKTDKPTPKISEIAAMQREAIGNDHVPDGYNLGLVSLAGLPPGETVTCSTPPTPGVRLAWLVVPDQFSLRRRRQYIMLET